MGKRIAVILLAAFVIYTAYLYGGFEAQFEEARSCEYAQTEIAVYRACMESAGRTGCRMQTDDFRKYHQLKDTLAERCAKAASTN